MAVRHAAAFPRGLAVPFSASVFATCVLRAAPVSSLRRDLLNVQYALLSVSYLPGTDQQSVMFRSSESLILFLCALRFVHALLDTLDQRGSLDLWLQTTTNLPPDPKVFSIYLCHYPRLLLPLVSYET